VEFKTIILTLNKFAFINPIKFDQPLTRDNVTATECRGVGDSCESTRVKEKADILSTSYDISIQQ